MKNEHKKKFSHLTEFVCKKLYSSKLIACRN